ncbi:MAG: hypothetical protein WCI17_05245 [bacterium]
MKLPKFIILLMLGVVTLALALAIVLLSARNERAQRMVQAQQLAINNGILGAQGQQISSAILQDMAHAAASNRNLRSLLGKYGYNVQPGVEAPASAGSAGKAAKKGGVRDE